MHVLAIGCHPDDLEAYCGGTLRKYVEQGAEVTMCHIANGDQGHVVIEPAELAQIRHLEAEHAGAILGVREVIDLGVSDMQVNRHSLEVTDAVADVVRRTTPDVIITHNPEDYMLDHVEASALAINGSFCSGLSHRPRSYPAFSSFVPIFFMDTASGVGFAPTHYVDITQQIETKLEAVACHASQVKWLMDHDDIDFVDTVRSWSRYRGYQCSVTYAEGFRPYSAYPRFSTRNLLP